MKNNNKTLLGGIQIFLSLYWIYDTISLYIDYQNPNIVFSFRYPNYVLFLNVLLSLMNIYFGIKLLIRQISIKLSYIIMLILITIGGLLNIVSIV